VIDDSAVAAIFHEIREEKSPELMNVLLPRDNEPRPVYGLAELFSVAFIAKLHRTKKSLKVQTPIVPFEDGAADYRGLHFVNTKTEGGDMENKLKYGIHVTVRAWIVNANRQKRGRDLRRTRIAAHKQNGPPTSQKEDSIGRLTFKISAWLSKGTAGSAAPLK
jgi:hypothetical protein